MKESYRKLYIDYRDIFCYEDENIEINDSEADAIEAFDHEVDIEYKIKCDQSYTRINKGIY